jgi:radical SAM protein with 4Fe4S-binding SPASM domain
VYRENDDIIINLTVTHKCYAGCKGCINSSLTFAGKDDKAAADMDCDPERDAGLVERIADKYPDRKITLCFYGGEPFMAPGVMERTRLILDKSPAAGRIKYMVYSSGDLIADAVEKYPALINKIWLYSISIDGSRKQHEQVRPGTNLEKIIDSLIKLRAASKGNILVWSTLREEQSLMDCFRQFISMQRHGLADYFFWHWADTRQPFDNFKSYSARYEEELELVMKHYTSWLSDGEILPVSHISELVLYFLEGKKRGHTACAVELAQNYDIQGGRVHACADLPPSLGAYSPVDSIDIPAAALQALVEYKEALGCRECSMHFYCGGRCPVQALAGSPERTGQICKLMHIHVNTVKRHIPFIGKMLSRHRISRQLLYDSSAFLTRYTDVIP